MRMIVFTVHLVLEVARQLVISASAQILHWSGDDKIKAIKQEML